MLNKKVNIIWRCEKYAYYDNKFVKALKFLKILEFFGNFCQNKSYMLKIIDKLVKKMVILLKKGQVEAKIDYTIHEKKFIWFCIFI